MLAQNTTLRKLNVESNYISGNQVVALVEALNVNKTVVELHVSNQVREFTTVLGSRCRDCGKVTGWEYWVKGAGIGGKVTWLDLEVRLYEVLF